MPAMQLRMTELDFRFQKEFKGAMPEAYERLLLDTFHGDASLFARSDEVELAWGIIDTDPGRMARNGQARNSDVRAQPVGPGRIDPVDGSSKAGCGLIPARCCIEQLRA